MPDNNHHDRNSLLDNQDPGKESDWVVIDGAALQAQLGNYPEPKDGRPSGFDLLEQFPTLKPVGVSDFSKREAFIQAIAALSPINKTRFEGKSVSLKDLLGSEKLVKLYHEAIAEEYESLAFRRAVLQEAYVSSRSPDTGEAMRVPVTGITGIGKTTKAKEFYQHLTGPAKESAAVDLQHDTHCFMIDGGIERELSQMRNLVASFAHAQGATDIKDLEKHKPDIKIKDILFDELQDNKKVDLIIPDTFAAPGKVEEAKRELDEWLDAGMQVAILSVETDPQHKKNVLQHMDETGTRRAALPKPVADGHKFVVGLNRNEIEIDVDKNGKVITPMAENKAYERESLNTDLAINANVEMVEHLKEKRTEYPNQVHLGHVIRGEPGPNGRAIFTPHYDEASTQQRSNSAMVDALTFGYKAVGTLKRTISGSKKDKPSSDHPLPPSTHNKPS